MAANLFKLAGADVRVAEADNVNNTEADAVFKSITATSIANFAVLAADANGKIIEGSPIQGPAGPAGPTGPIGPQGPKGETGATGSVAEVTYAGAGDVVTDILLDKTTSKLIIGKNIKLATVATSGSYNDLTDKPTIPTFSYDEATGTLSIN